MNPGIPVAIVAAARKKARDGIVKTFRDAGAIGPQHAQALGERFTSRRAKSELAHLIDAGVIRQPQAGRFYLDERALSEHHPSRRRVAAMVVIGATVLVLLIVLLTNLPR